MPNANSPPEQPVAISAAELRRRLLASTPPPMAAAVAAAPVADAKGAALGEPQVPPPTMPAGGAQQILAQLRMPGKSGVVAVAASRPAPAVPIATDPLPPRSVASRRPAANYLDPDSALAGALNNIPGMQDSGRFEEPTSDFQRLKSENKELRKLLVEMKQLLQEASETEQKLVAKEKEFEAAVSAKEAQIEELNTQLGSIEEQIAKGELAPPPPVPKTRTELEEWGDELEKENAKLQQERKRLDDERRQLREDEEALESQMREMEVSMARERALIARQETELRRLNAEIQHELELMQRGDATLREQMAKFQRRAQEVLVKPPSGNGRR
jgi:hypothetical protein